MTQPEPTQDDPQFDPIQESAQQDAQQQVGDSQQVWQGNGSQQPATPPATPQPLSSDDIQKMAEQGDQSEVSQQQIDAATGAVDDTLPEGVNDWPRPAPATTDDAGATPDDQTSQGA
jgi:hypothetical protein